MQKGEKFIRWFSELSNKDVAIAGGKGASLAEMYNAHIPVPPGFCITAQAYEYFIKNSGLDNKIKDLLKNLDINETEKLSRTAEKIRAMIEDADLPKEMSEEITDAYEILSVDKTIGEEDEDMETMLKKPIQGVFVAVRSSATTEDLTDASFAGQQESFLNTRGDHELLENVKKCMASLFTARAIYYRQKKGFEHDKALLSVVVQKMINAKKSGVMFSQNPTNKDHNVIIEAVWGLGEGIVSGQINPDHYAINSDLDNFKIEVQTLGKKKIAIVRDENGKTAKIKLSEEENNAQVLTSYEVKRLAQFAQQLERHYGKPQDIEFAVDKTGIFIVQSRPITTIGKARASEEDISGEIILSGMGASPGVGSGTVKIIHSIEQLDKVQKGDVLVTEMTNPDMVVAMERAAAIITDEGGITSHAAIVSREMGIPAVVGTGEATKKLKDGQKVTVDGTAGKIYLGEAETHTNEIEPIVPTKTEIKVIVDVPNAAIRAAKSGSRAVGLLRLEGIIAAGGKHPLYFVQSKNMNEYIKILSKGLKKIVEHFEEIWVRTSDVRSDEYKNLQGAPQHVEDNPMLGDHGVRFSLKHQDIMRAELIAIKEVADDFPKKIFGIMIPQVISADEVKQTKQLEKEIVLPKNIKIGIMVETPAAVQVIEEICKEGIQFASFGTNDLTQYTLAIDRNNSQVQHLFNEMHPAILSSIKNVISICKKYHVQTSICGQAGSKEEMVRFLMSQGIDSISVNADAAKSVSLLVQKLEAQHFENSNSSPSNAIIVEQSAQTNHTKHEHINHATHTPQQKKQIPADDIEQLILKELDGEENEDYSPGESQEKQNKKEIPSLNDSIPFDTFFENA